MSKIKTIKNSGITLIALVITIIVLLILAGVSIAMLTGENGILTQANEAKTSTEIGEEKEKVKLSAAGALAKDNGGEIKRNYLNEELTGYIGTEGTDYTLSESETAPFVVKYLSSGRSYEIDENGNVNEYVDISEYVQIGQFVDYDPTVLDKSGTPIEASKLTYTSLTGSGIEHGNGYTSLEEDGGQKFTATANIKWKVLSIENEKVTLISEEPIKKNEISEDSGNFVMKGAIGYLYAEQELNEICKIYGYGYGADTSQITKYYYGGPVDGELTGQITGSGARSITIEDINKQSGIKENDYFELNNDYGSIANPTINIMFPTINTTNGISELSGVKKIKNTNYFYSTTKIGRQDILVNGNYWLASRCIASNSSSSNFCVRFVGTINVSVFNLCDGVASNVIENLSSSFSVRPVVTLKTNAIDINTNYEAEGHWNLK